MTSNEDNYCVKTINYKNINYVTIVSCDKEAELRLLKNGKKMFVCYCVDVCGVKWLIGGNGGDTIKWIGDLLRNTFKDDYKKLVSLVRMDL